MVPEYNPKADIKLASYIENAQIAKSVIMNEGSYIKSGTVSNAQIGKFVSIAYNVIIGPTEHNTKLPSMSSFSINEVTEYLHRFTD